MLHAKIDMCDFLQVTKSGQHSNLIESNYILSRGMLRGHITILSKLEALYTVFEKCMPRSASLIILINNNNFSD